MSGNIFDNLADSTFDVVTATMGFDATWKGLTARILYNEPARNEFVSEYEYKAARPTMEFKSKDFPGLKEIVDTKTSGEIVDIEGKQFLVREVIGMKQSARDGQSYTAFLEPIE